ncbi:hypothetical protein NBRC116592_36630 [Colwellia sp. KU-HH00111]|uniref:XrtA/PEP-CTERM system TPR-repeat protein PrsT n=1 Tax=Colwellia sp. KU-HH00111 TaxID=3127652 RepID=UPI00310633B1
MKKEIIKSLIGIGGAIVFTACSPTLTPSEHIEKSKHFSAENNHGAAIVELKNAIKSAPSNLNARILLGKAYMKVGNGESAEKEFNKALELGGKSEEIKPLLLEVLNYNGNYDEVSFLIAQLEDDLPAEAFDAAYLQYAIALTYASQLKNHPEVAEHLKNSANPSFHHAGVVFEKVIAGNLPNIEQALDELPAVELNKEFWFLSGTLYLSNQNFTKATEMFDKYQGDNTGNLRLYLYKAQSLIGESKTSEAETLVDQILSKIEGQPLANHMKSIIAYKKEEFELAKIHAEKSIQSGLSTDMNRLVAGLSAYKLKSFEVASQYLSSVVERLPVNHPARKVYVLVQNELGYSAESPSIFNDTNAIAEEDFDLLVQVSQNFINNGEYEKAQALISKADDVSSIDAIFKRGVLKLSMNDLDGILDLERTLNISSDHIPAKVALTQVYLVQKNFEKSLELAKELVSSAPEKAVSHKLLARAYLGLGDRVKAEKQIREAHKIDADDTSSVLFLVKLLFEDAREQAAIDILRKNLDRKPTDIRLLSALYYSEKKQGNPEHSLKLIKTTLDGNVNNLNLKLLYGTALFEEKRYKDVVSLWNNLRSQQVSSQVFWNTLGESYLQINDINAAISVFEQWHSLFPKQKTAAIRLANSYERANQFEKALNVVKQGLSRYANDEQLILLSIYYKIRLGDYDGAMLAIQQLSKTQQSSPLIKGLKGQALYGMKKYKEASTYLVSQYEIEPNTRHISLLSSAYNRAGQNDKAIVALKRHLKNRPTDYFAKGLLAQYAMDSDLALSRTHYKELLKQYPNNASLLNNLAWVEYKDKNYSEAKAVVNQALLIAPDNAKILDTLGMIHMALGDKESARSAFNKALLISPNDANIAEHLKSASQ